jgi:hypothetical protein
MVCPIIPCEGDPAKRLPEGLSESEAVRFVPLTAFAESSDSGCEWLEETSLFGDALSLIRSSREPTSQPFSRRESMRWELDDFESSHTVSFSCCFQCCESGHSIGKVARDAIVDCLRDGKTLVGNYLQRLTRQEWEVFCDDVRAIAQESRCQLPLYVALLTDGTRSQTTTRGMSYQKNVKDKHCGRPKPDQALIDFVEKHRMFSIRDTVKLSRRAFNAQKLPKPLTEGTVKRIRKKLGQKGIQ